MDRRRSLWRAGGLLAAVGHHRHCRVQRGKHATERPCDRPRAVRLGPGGVSLAEDRSRGVAETVVDNPRLGGSTLCASEEPKQRSLELVPRGQLPVLHQRMGRHDGKLEARVHPSVPGAVGAIVSDQRRATRWSAGRSAGPGRWHRLRVGHGRDPVLRDGHTLGASRTLAAGRDSRSQLGLLRSDALTRVRACLLSRTRTGCPLSSPPRTEVPIGAFRSRLVRGSCPRATVGVCSGREPAQVVVMSGRR
jgi:hypothetical protein